MPDIACSADLNVTPPTCLQYNKAVDGAIGRSFRQFLVSDDHDRQLLRRLMVEANVPQKSHDIIETNFNVRLPTIGSDRFPQNGYKSVMGVLEVNHENR